MERWLGGQYKGAGKGIGARGYRRGDMGEGDLVG